MMRKIHIGIGRLCILIFFNFISNAKRAYLFKVLLLVFLIFCFTGCGSISPSGPKITVNVNYNGTGVVDANHRIWIVLLSPVFRLGYTEPVFNDAASLTSASGTVRFDANLSSCGIYVTYDKDGSFSETNLYKEGNSFIYYNDKFALPFDEIMIPDEGIEINIAFDDTYRWAKIYGKLILPSPANGKSYEVALDDDGGWGNQHSYGQLLGHSQGLCDSKTTIDYTLFVPYTSPAFAAKMLGGFVHVISTNGGAVSGDYLGFNLGVNVNSFVQSQDITLSEYNE